MATLQIRKETNKVWKHVPSDALPYIVSKLYIKSDGDLIRVVEQGGSQRGQYNFADVSVYNIGGVAETFGSAQQLMERLEALNYIGFFYEGEVSPSELISSDVDNAIELGTDGKLFAPISGGGGAVDSVNGQTGVVVLDATDVSALSNDTTDYTDATTPLAGTEIALVEQGGTFKKVAVSEFGGEDILTLTIHPLNSGFGNVNWITYVASQSIFNQAFSTGTTYSNGSLPDITTLTLNSGGGFVMKENRILQSIELCSSYGDWFDQEFIVAKADVNYLNVGNVINLRFLTLNRVTISTTGTNFRAYKPNLIEMFQNDIDDVPEGYFAKYMIFTKAVGAAAGSSRIYFNWNFKKVR